MSKLFLKSKTNEINFIKKWIIWFEKHKDFLDERTLSSTTGELFYTYQRVSSKY